MAKVGTYKYPRGWFVIAFSDELSPGDVKPLHYFGTDMVLFRTMQGRPCVLDAYCPHLGAHLGNGGVVDGETIKCPFHAWCFDGAGHCTDIPYAKKIPAKSHLDAWPVLERNGMIFLFHDSEGGSPDYEIPVMAEYGHTEWMPWDHSVMTIKTHPREIIENVVDLAHFSSVHGTKPQVFENEFNEHMAVQHNKGVAFPRGGGRDDYDLVATYHGPAYQVTHMKGVLRSRMVNAHTPIDEDNLHLRFAVSLKIVGDRDRTEQFSKKYIENLRVGFLEDVAIWEHKLWRDKPVLCDGDGPIAKIRKWYKQFYEPRVTS